MLKRDYPIYFDETEINIKHRTWQVGYANSVVINTTEAGTDDVEYIRFKKATIRASFRVTDEWAQILTEFGRHPGIEVRYYDTEEMGYVTKDMRMDGLSVAEIQKSDTLESTNGVYDISFNLVEF